MTSRRGPAAGETRSFGPLTASQASFIWGRAEIFETPLSVNVSAFGVGDERRARRAIVRIVEKYFVDDQGTLYSRQKAFKPTFIHAGVRSGGIVGMNDDDRPRARSGRFVQRIEIDLPAVVVNRGDRARASRPQDRPGTRTMDSSGFGKRISSPGLHSSRNT